MQTLGGLDGADAATTKRRLLESYEEFEHSFRRNYPVIWLATLIGPLLTTIGLLAFLWWEAGGEYVQKLVGTAFATFFFFGRFVILGGQDSAEVASFMTSGQLFWMVTYMDVMVALLLAFHIGFLFKLPYLGPKVCELIADGRMILKANPWMKRATAVGLVAFVMFPLAATGSVGGSIFGRLVGMTRLATVSWVAVGSLLGNGIMYGFSDLINTYFDKDSPQVKYGGILCIVLLIFFLERRYRKMKQAFLAEDAAAETKIPGNDVSTQDAA